MKSTAESILSGLSLPSGSKPFVPQVAQPVAQKVVEPVVVLGDSPSAEEDISGLPTLKEVEKAYLFKVLGAVNGNKTKASQVLGVSIKTIYNMLNSYAKENGAKD